MAKGELVHASIFPHPPIMVPAVGPSPGDIEKTRPTREAAQRLAREIAGLKPETVVLITPHGPLHPRAMGIMANARLHGDLAYFRVPQVAFTCDSDPVLCRCIQEAAEKAFIPLLVRDQYQPLPLDHGTVVPLYFLIEAGIDSALVPLTFSYLPFEEHVRYGQALARAIAASGRKVAVVASGDLSHRLLPSAPAGYNPRGKDFDRVVVEAVGKGDWKTIQTIDPDLVEEAGECGYRSMLILSGILAEHPFKPEVYSYDAPYGVGYLVASLPPVRPNGGNPGPAGVSSASELDLSSPVALARQAVETWVNGGRYLPVPESLPPAWGRQSGVFVTIKKGEQLRGCIGTYRPTHGSICGEILRNAVLAAVQDPRFPPVSSDELADLNYSVNLLNPLEPVNSLDELDPLRYGVMISSGDRQGLLLPDLPTIRTVDEQLACVRAKAGLGPDEPIQIYRFTTRYYEEGEPLEENTSPI